MPLGIDLKLFTAFRADISNIGTDDVTFIAYQNSLLCLDDLGSDYLALTVTSHAQGMVFSTSHRVEIRRVCSLDIFQVGHDRHISPAF